MVRFSGVVCCESELSNRFEIRAALMWLAVVALKVLGCALFRETFDRFVILDAICFMGMLTQLALELGINVDSLKIPLNSTPFPTVSFVVPIRCHLMTWYATSGKISSTDTIVGTVQIAIANLLNFL